MPTSSARPDHLRQYAADTAATAARPTAVVDEVARALSRHLAGGGDPGTTFHAVSTARAAVERFATVGVAARQIAAAFEAADRGPAGWPAAVADVPLARHLRSLAAGFADEELLAPERHAAGAAWGERFASLSPARQREGLASVEHVDGYGPSFAAGVLQALGAVGVTKVVTSVREDYERTNVELGAADDALGRMGSLLEDATRTMTPATTPAELEAALRAAATPHGGPYVLDLGLVQDLGRTRAGREALRHLVLVPLTLPAQVVAAIAGPLTAAPAVDDNSTTDVLWLLEDRLQGRYGQGEVDLDLPLLEQLGRSPLAAWAWERQGGTGASRIARHLGRKRGEAGSTAMAGILDGVLVQSVRQDWAKPAGALRADQAEDQRGLPHLVDLDAIIAATGHATPSPALSHTLVDVLRTHPEAFRALAGAPVYSRRPNPVLTGYFAVLAADRSAISRAVASITPVYVREARKALERNPPRPIDPNEVVGGIADGHHLLLALADGATVAGHHHSAFAAFAVWAAERGATFGAGTLAQTGPWGATAAVAVRAVLPHAAREATERWVDRDDGRERNVQRATARAEPYLLATAMADDPRWRAVMVEPERLRGLDVVRSATDRRKFQRWLERQPAEVTAPLASLIESGGPG